MSRDIAVTQKAQPLSRWLAGGAAALSLGLVGCATPTPLPAEHPLSRAYSYVVVDATRTRPTSPIQANPYFRDRKAGDGYLQYSTYYSPGGALTERRWMDGFRTACTDIGGVLIQRYCTSRSDPDRVLFAFQLKAWNSNNTSSVEAIYFEPTAQPPSPVFALYSREAGYLPTAEREARERAAKTRSMLDEARREAAAESDRQLNLARIQKLKVRGLTVCRDEGNIRDVAFVEDFADEKLQLRVTARRYVSAPLLSPPGFQQMIIWSTPLGWYECEQVRR